MSTPEKKRGWGGARNYPKYRAEKRIIEALQKHGPMTARELAAVVFLSHEGICARMRRLKKGLADFPRCRIAGWKPPCGPGPHTPRYGIGSKPDAKLVRIGRYAPDRKRKNRHEKRDALLLELAAHGPMTMKEIVAFTGLSASGAGRILAKLKKGVVPLARVRVCGYDRVGVKGQQTPRFALGNAYDVRPAVLTPKERHRRTYEKNQALIAARAKGRHADPFDGLLQAAA